MVDPSGLSLFPKFIGIGNSPNMFTASHELQEHVRVIAEKVTPGKVRFFRSCWIRIIELWSLYEGIRYFSNQYRQFGFGLCHYRLEDLKLLEYLNVDEVHLSYRTPLLETQFETFLWRAKSALDFYSKAAGSIFEHTAPANVDGLRATLQDVGSGRDSCILAKNLLGILDLYSSSMRGVVLRDSFAGKSMRSLRDEATHYGSLEIVMELPLGYSSPAELASQLPDLSESKRISSVCGPYVRQYFNLRPEGRTTRADLIAESVQEGIFGLVSRSFKEIAAYLSGL